MFAVDAVPSAVVANDWADVANPNAVAASLLADVASPAAAATAVELTLAICLVVTKYLTMLVQPPKIAGALKKS